MAEGERLGASFSIDVTKLKSGLAQANRLIRESESEFKKAAAGMDTFADKQKLVEAKADSLNKIIEIQKEKVRAQKEQYQKLINEGLDPTSARAVQLRTDINNEQAALSKNEKELEKQEQALREMAEGAEEAGDGLEEAGEQAEKSSGGYTVLKNVIANLVTDVLREAVSAMKEFVASTVEVGKLFDSSMSQVAAVSGATGDELETLRDKAKEMGETTKFTATEAADAFNYMAMAGWKTEDMLGGIEGILNLAAASGSDLATTSDIVTDALTAMGYSAGDAGRLADVMAAASSNANTNVEMMGATFQYAAPIVGALGYNMEDTAVAIGLMANAGIKGEKAGTALRSIMTRLSAPPAEAAKAMDALGISITNADGTMKPLNEVIGIMREKFADLGEAEQAQMAKALGGQEAMSGLLAIVNAAPADFDKLTDAVKNSEGAAAQMSETMLDNLGGDMTILQSKIEGIKITLYEKLEPALRDAIQAFQDWADSVDWEAVAAKIGTALDKITSAFGWIKDNKDAIIAALTGMAAALGTYLAYTTAVKIMTEGFMALEIAQKAVAAAQALMNGVMMLNPIGIVIAAIVGLVAAFVVLWKKSEGFRDFWIGLWDKIKSVATGAWTSLKDGAANAWEGIKNIFSKVTTFFGDIFSKAWQKVKDVFSSGGKVFSGIKEGIEKTFKSIVNTLIRGVNKVVSVPFNAINKMLQKIKNVEILGISPFTNLISGFEIPKIPELAKGGIVRGATNAIIGEDGAEAIIPLERNTEWIDKVADKIASKQQPVIVNQTNNYSQAHSRFELYKSKQQTAAAVRLALTEV